MNNDENLKVSAIRVTNAKLPVDHDPMVSGYEQLVPDCRQVSAADAEDAFEIHVATTATAVNAESARVDAPAAPRLARPGWDLWFLRQAYVVAQRGSCLRKQVGAIVVRDRDRRVLSEGYNGAPSRMPDCGEVGCDVRTIDGRPSCVRTLHAESNALDLCGPASEPLTLYATVIPCRNCAMRILQHGSIHRVVYHEWYQSQGTTEVAEMFKLASMIRHRGVQLVHLDVPTGCVRGAYDEAP